MTDAFRPAIHRPRRDLFDFRKSFRGLAPLVKQESGHNPFDSGLNVFTKRIRN